MEPAAQSESNASVEHDDRVRLIAEYLAGRHFRFMNTWQIAYLRKTFKATRDEARAGAIMADRIRRARQVAEHGPAFKVIDMVEPSAPIVLKVEYVNGKRVSVD